MASCWPASCFASAAVTAAEWRFTPNISNLSRPLLDTLARFIATIGRAAAVNALTQSLLALSVPGIPDLFQGSEGEHLALADPDNRRPVDYAALTTALARPVASLAALLDDPGQAKVHLVGAARGRRRSVRS